MAEHRRQKKDITLRIDRDDVQRLRAAHESGATACVVVIAGLDAGAFVAMTGDEITVGRDEGCDLALRDDGVSRRHIRLRRQLDDTLEVTDLDSTNGTFIGQRRIIEGSLAPGDKVIVGLNTILRYELQDGHDKGYQKQMHEARVRDWLTGVFNRRFFDDQLPAELSHSYRHKRPLTVALLDIDHFKRINDAFGHSVGDAVLVAFCKALRELLRAEDLLARVGGEEFVVLARDTHHESACHLAERLRRCVAELRVVHDAAAAPIRITASVGAVSVSIERISSASDVLSRVDRNLYAAKAAGRNCVVVTRVDAEDDRPASRSAALQTYRLRRLK